MRVAAFSLCWLYSACTLYLAFASAVLHPWVCPMPVNLCSSHLAASWPWSVMQDRQQPHTTTKFERTLVVPSACGYLLWKNMQALASLTACTAGQRLLQVKSSGILEAGSCINFRLHIAAGCVTLLRAGLVLDCVHQPTFRSPCRLRECAPLLQQISHQPHPTVTDATGHATCPLPYCRLHHQNVVALYGACLAAPNMFLVEELMHASLVSAIYPASQPLPLIKALKVCVGISIHALRYGQ